MSSPGQPGGGSGRPRSGTLERMWEDVEQLIAGSHLFRSLDEDGRTELLERGRIVFYPAGAVIVRETEVGGAFYVIDQGVVEVSTSSPEAGDVSLTTLQRGGVFGEVAALTGAARTATVTALTNVAAVSFDRQVIDEVLSRYPKARRLLDALIAGRARDTVEKIARASVMPGRADGMSSRPPAPDASDVPIIPGPPRTPNDTGGSSGA